MAFSRKILQLFNGICNIMVSPNVRNLIFATIVSLFFQATHSILNSHALISTTHVRKNCSWSKSRWSEQKVWFSQTLISNPRCYATGKGFLCLCTMQYKWPLFPIQLVFCAFLCICKGIFVYWILAMQIRLGNVISYICYADHRLLTKPFDNFQHLPLDAPLYWKGGAMHDLMSPYRH